MLEKKYIVEEIDGNKKITKSFLTRKSAQKYLLKRCREITAARPDIAHEPLEVLMSKTFKVTTCYK